MNWKVVLQLSIFGLAMGILTVFVIPSNIEPLCWLAIFVYCAWVIGKAAVPLPFVHGLMIGIVNSVWITATHVLLYNQYVTNHAKELQMMKGMPMADSPRMLMALTGPVVGVISGVILGVFALIASKVMNRTRAAASPA